MISLTLGNSRVHVCIVLEALLDDRGILVERGRNHVDILQKPHGARTSTSTSLSKPREGRAKLVPASAYCPGLYDYRQLLAFIHSWKPIIVLACLCWCTPVILMRILFYLSLCEYEKEQLAKLHKHAWSGRFRM